MPAIFQADYSFWQGIRLVDSLDFLSVTDCSLGNLPRGNFIALVLDMSREQ